MERLNTLDQYVTAMNYFCASAEKRIGRNGAVIEFREEHLSLFSFVDLSEVPEDKTISLLDFVESQYQKGKRQRRTSPTRFNRNALDRVEENIKAARAAGQEAVLVVDLDSTLYIYQERVFKLLGAWDKDHGTHYFDKFDPRQFDTQEKLSESLHRFLGPKCASFHELSHLVEEVNLYVMSRALRGPAIETDLIEPELARYLQSLQGVKIVFLTARPDFYASETAERMRLDGFPNAEVIYRQIDVKKEVYKSSWIADFRQRNPKATIVGVFDDDRAILRTLSNTFPDLTIIRVVQRPEQKGFSSYLMEADSQMYPALQDGVKRCQVVLGAAHQNLLNSHQ